MCRDDYLPNEYLLVPVSSSCTSWLYIWSTYEEIVAVLLLERVLRLDVLSRKSCTRKGATISIPICTMMCVNSSAFLCSSRMDVNFCPRVSWLSNFLAVFWPRLLLDGACYPRAPRQETWLCTCGHWRTKRLRKVQVRRFESYSCSGLDFGQVGVGARHRVYTKRVQFEAAGHFFWELSGSSCTSWVLSCKWVFCFTNAGFRFRSILMQSWFCFLSKARLETFLYNLRL